MHRFPTILSGKPRSGFWCYVVVILLFWSLWVIVGSRPSTDYLVFNHTNDILGLDMLDHEGTFDYEPM